MLDSDSTLDQPRQQFEKVSRVPQATIPARGLVLGTIEDRFAITQTDPAKDQDFSEAALDRRSLEAGIVSQQGMAKMAPALHRVLDALRLPPNWDGDNGRAPSPDTVETAALLLALVSMQASPPRVFVVGDGEIGFEWRSEQGRVQVSFFEDGEVAVIADGAGEGIRGIFSRKTLPIAELRLILSEI